MDLIAFITIMVCTIGLLLVKLKCKDQCDNMTLLGTTLGNEYCKLNDVYCTNKTAIMAKRRSKSLYTVYRIYD